MSNQDPISTDAVSIIMPAFNAAKVIGETIDSIRSQTHSNWNLHVTDDCSSDDTMDVLRRYAEDDARVFVHALARNSGAAAARNLSLSKARDRYIAFLDCDDIWMPHKLESQLEFMRDRQVAFSFTQYHLFEHEIGDLDTTVDVRTPMSVDYHQLLRKECTVGCSTVMLDSHRFDSIRMPLIRTGQDYALWLSLLRGTDLRAHKLAEPLSAYRIRPGSISRNKFKKALRQFEIYTRIENIPLPRALYYMAFYAKNAVFRK